MMRPSQVLRLTRSVRPRVMEQGQTQLLLRRSSTTSLRSTTATNLDISATSATSTTTQRDQLRQFHSTSYLMNDEEDKKVQKEEEDDAPPAWQNPLHHNNPEMAKQFAEDFKDGEKMVANPLPPFEEDPGKTLAAPHIHDLANQIVNLTLLELRELTGKIADHFGFDEDVMAASYGGGMVAGGGAAGGAGAEEEVKEEKTIFDLKLIGFDAKAKIKVIKEIRAITGLGLKEAKELVESAPKVVQKDLKQDKADELKAQLEAAGAQVEIA